MKTGELCTGGQWGYTKMNDVVNTIAKQIKTDIEFTI